MRHSLKAPLYTVTGNAGVGFEIAEGRGFYVPTLFVESARERARQEWAVRPFISAALYENGKCVGFMDWRDFEEAAKAARSISSVSVMAPSVSAMQSRL